MTDKITEARRVAFEAWWVSQKREVFVGGTKCHSSDFVLALRVWNAAIDSVCVEMPEKYGEPDSISESFWDEAIDECREAIEQAGVRCK